MLRVQWSNDYPSTTQVVSHVAVSRGSGQLLWCSVDVYLWKRAIPLWREYNNKTRPGVLVWDVACSTFKTSIQLFFFPFLFSVFFFFPFGWSSCFQYCFLWPKSVFHRTFLYLLLLLLLIVSLPVVICSPHWSLNDNKSPLFTRIPPCIRDDLNSAVVLTVSVLSLDLQFSDKIQVFILFFAFPLISFYVLIHRWNLLFFSSF